MELFRALGALCEPPAAAHRRLAYELELPGEPRSDDYAQVFLFQLYPYASVYLGGEGKLGGEARESIAGFWRALGLVPPAEPDHLAALLGLYAALAEQEQIETDEARRLLRAQARRALLHEHLLTWAGPYLERFEELAPPFYRAWAALLRAALDAEAEELGLPEALPAALRAAPELQPPSAVGGPAFLEQLLAPVRTGLIIVRDDLVAAGRTLGLGLRIAERRFVLTALLGQDAAGTLAWLSERTRAQSARPGGDVVSAFWNGRAAATAGLLAEALQHVHPS